MVMPLVLLIKMLGLVLALPLRSGTAQQEEKISFKWAFGLIANDGEVMVSSLRLSKTSFFVSVNVLAVRR